MEFIKSLRYTMPLQGDVFRKPLTGSRSIDALSIAAFHAARTLEVVFAGWTFHDLPQCRLPAFAAQLDRRHTNGTGSQLTAESAGALWGVTVGLALALTGETTPHCLPLLRLPEIRAHATRQPAKGL